MSRSDGIVRAASLIACIGLVVAIVAAARPGLADIYSTPAQSYLVARSDTASASDTALELSREEVDAIGENLRLALALTPNDPELMSWHGRIFLYRLVPDELDATEILQLGDAAARQFNAALAARPTWPWDWLNLATSRYEQFRDGSNEYHQALVRAMQFGSNEPTVHAAVAQLGLDSWSSLNPDAARAVLQAIESSLQRNEPFLVELTEFSEAWTEVCAELKSSYARIQEVCKQHDLT